MNTISPDEIHLRVLRLLEVNPEMSQRERAEALGVSLGKTNYCLNAMLEKGLIKVRNFRNSRSLAAYGNYLTPEGIHHKVGLKAGFLKRKIAEYEALNREIEVLETETGQSAEEA